MNGCCNMFYGDAKTGKTRFLLGMIDAYVNGSPTFLGQKLTEENHEILILGPDMQQNTWSRFLTDYHLGERDGSIHERIRGIVAQGMAFRLDRMGIDMVVDHCRESPGLIIVIDSLSTAMSGLGLDENKPNYVDPLEELMDAVAPFKATLIIIHHSKKDSGNGSLATIARGTSALTAKVDQLISMKEFQSSKYGESTGEVELRTKGRAGKPVTLVVQQDEATNSWRSSGSPTELRRRQESIETGEKLSDQQEKLIKVLLASWATDKQPMTAEAIARGMGIDFKTGRTRVYGYLTGLIEKKGFVVEMKPSKGSTDKGKKLFKPTQRALDWAIPVPSF